MMRIDLTYEADTAFRDGVRAFIRESLTPPLREAAERQTFIFSQPSLAIEWHKILYNKGWVAPNWPAEYGGTGWTASQRLIFENECAWANTPVLPAMSLQMCGPVLMKHGTAKQKERFLPRILSGEDFWCQGYSEPDAGSDLASLRTRAVRDGDHYVINGSKIWTTYAHVANWIFLLVRTDPTAKLQKGITFLLAPMNSPGISVTRILSMSGEHEVNQVLLDDVRVPVELRVGAENDGWTVAKYVLEFERGGGSATARTVRVVRLLHRMADEGSLEPEFAHRLTRLQIELDATEWTQRRIIADAAAGRSVGQVNASLLKLKASELYQEACTLFHDALGAWGLVDQRSALENRGPVRGPDFAMTAAARYMNSRAASIFGGSSEIQRSILAKHVLGS